MIKRQADFSNTYTARAEHHRPTDLAELNREVKRLSADGLRPRDIAQALRMNDADVLAILASAAP